MTLLMFTSDLLRTRALNSLAEIQEWYGELESDHLEPDYRERVWESITFASAALGEVLAELARRGELTAHQLGGSQLSLGLIEPNAIADPEASDRTSFYRMDAWLAAPDDPF